jgi:hypothetical protein
MMLGLFKTALTRTEYTLSAASTEDLPHLSQFVNGWGRLTRLLREDIPPTWNRNLASPTALVQLCGGTNIRAGSAISNDRTEPLYVPESQFGQTIAFSAFFHRSDWTTHLARQALSSQLNDGGLRRTLGQPTASLPSSRDHSG